MDEICQFDLETARAPAPGSTEQPRLFGDFAEVQSAFDLDEVSFRDPVKIAGTNGHKVTERTVGRVLFNATISEDLRFVYRSCLSRAIHRWIRSVVDSPCGGFAL